MVSIKGGVHFDLVKRVLRDISRSGQAPDEIIQQVSRLACCWMQHMQRLQRPGSAGSPWVCIVRTARAELTAAR